MKKWMCLLLALVTVFSLTACGDQDEKREEETQNSTQTTGDTQPAETLTREEQDALDHALELLETIPYSREGLISQMVHDGYAEAAAAAAVDRTGLDWKEQAVKSAEEYVKYLPMSRTGVAQMLEYDRFTPDEVAYAMEQLNDVDWDMEADEAVEKYLQQGVSKRSLEENLEFQGFTPEQIRKAVTKTADVDWDKQAVLCAKGYLEAMEFTRDSLIGQLKYEGFTTAQAEYAADQCGF